MKPVRLPLTLLAAAMTAFLTFALAGPAFADGTVAVEYYVVPEHHPDVDHGIDGTIVTGLVEGRLGPHGLPIATAFGRRTGGPKSGPIRDVNSDGEILWWSSASKHGVKLDARGHTKLPLQNTNMYPAGHKDDATGFRAAHFRGTFDAGSQSSVPLKLGSDDDAWVFVDGTLRVDNGGVKAMQFTPYVLGKLSPGRHVLDIFYADRYGYNAAIEIDAPFTVTAAPLGAPLKGGGTRVAAAHPAKPSLDAAQMRSQLQKTGRFTLRDIHFAFDAATIERQSTAVLGEVGKVLRGDRGLRLRIEGYTDNAGAVAYNRELSERRVAAVKAYLVTRCGVTASQLETAGFGAMRPIAPNETAEGRALNRRVEFVRL